MLVNAVLGIWREQESLASLWTLLIGGTRVGKRIVERLIEIYQNMSDMKLFIVILKI